MPDPNSEHGFPTLTADTDEDDIEILEVVGVEGDDDEPVAAPASVAAPGAAPRSVETQPAPAPVHSTHSGAGSPAAQATAEPPRGSAAVPLIDDRERLLRVHADFENYKRRVERERQATQAQASWRLVSRLLPALDNFERALSSAVSTEQEQSLREGVILIFRQILDELRKEGLEAVDSVGQTFDPRFHEAVDTSIQGDFPPNTVVEELRRGYLLNGRLLRPALVKVTMPAGEEP